MGKIKNKYMEIKNVNKDIVNWVEDVAEENNCRVERKEWKSKYNSYVVYDYEPFCSEGFEINILLSSFDISYLNFIKYLYKEKISTIEYLDNCAKIPAVKNYIVWFYKAYNTYVISSDMFKVLGIQNVFFAIGG